MDKNEKTRSTSEVILSMIKYKGTDRGCLLLSL